MAKKYQEKTIETLSKMDEYVADKQAEKVLELADRPVIDDKKINVLLMGVSGAGKSTLINAVLGEEKAKVGDGFAVTQKMKVYETEDVLFRMVDTVGLEYNFMRQEKILKELSKWSEEGLNKKKLKKLVHCIWFCIDAQSKRVSEESLNYLYKISKMWEGVPIIVVFTKSYSTIAIKENEEMFQKVLAKYQKRKTLNVCAVVSILARELVIDESTTLSQYGVDKLIEETSALIPRAREINEEVMTNWSYKMRRDAANKYVKVAKHSVIANKADNDDIWDAMLSKIYKAYSLDDTDIIIVKEKTDKVISHKSFALKVSSPLRIPHALVNYRVTGKIGDAAIKEATKIHKAKNKK